MSDPRRRRRRRASPPVNERTNQAWRSVDRHRKPPKKAPSPDRGRVRRKGCAVTVLTVGAATLSAVATWRGLT